jgi:hypothetical protein
MYGFICFRDLKINQKYSLDDPLNQEMHRHKRQTGIYIGRDKQLLHFYYNQHKYWFFTEKVFFSVSYLSTIFGIQPDKTLIKKRIIMEQRILNKILQKITGDASFTY